MSKNASKFPPDRMLTLEYVAWLLDCTKRTVQRMVADGEFPSVVYITKTDLRIPEDSYREFIRQRTVDYRPMIKGSR